MHKLSTTGPEVVLRAEGVEEQVEELARIVEQLRREVVSVINANVPIEYDQNGQPTPEVGHLAVWKDADAASGQSTHYLVYNMDGTVVTFASVEVVP